MAQTYTADHFPSLMVASQNADNRNLISAADYLAQILQTNGVVFAFMGGFAVNLRGSGRTTHDVDIAVGTTMLELRQTFIQQQRVVLPAGPTSGVLRIFVKTGGPWDGFDIPEKTVEIDLILSGALGFPENFQTDSEIISTNTVLGIKQYPVLTILYMMRSKLNAFYDRQSVNDYEDITWLTAHYPVDVYQIRMQLDYEYRLTFLQAYIHQYQGSNEQKKIRLMKHILGIA
ncbi:MAG: hypothetical protein M1834_007065 [Cirrosporium novae-zelandiae]|nr:MAG: hypothetical protein M1834_007065 [Cirrosporium novae-zelandiae]